MNLVKEEYKTIATLVSKPSIAELAQRYGGVLSQNKMEKAEVVEYIILVQRVYEDPSKKNKICKSRMVKKRVLRIPKSVL